MRRLAIAAAAALLGVVGAAGAASADDAARAKQWHLDRIGAPVEGADGGGIVVAVIDSGVDLDHPDLAGRLVPGIDLVDDDADPDDPFGHGTHVAGIVAASRGGGEAVGVAPGVQVMPVRVLDEQGSGLLTDVVDGVRWAVAHGADVVNLSLGEDTQAVLGPSFGEALREAWAAGVVPVVAAGNELVTSSGFDDQPALVVSATNAADAKPAYSSGVGAARWGLAAPGGDPPETGDEAAILSTYKDGGYAWIAGTSQAAPMVSGAVASLLGVGLTPQQAVERVLSTAVDIGAPGRDATFGAGRLDLRRALEGFVRPTQAAPAAEAATTTSTTTTGTVLAATTTTTVSEGAGDAERDRIAAPGPRLAPAAAAVDEPADEEVPLALALLAGALVLIAAGATARQRRVR